MSAEFDLHALDKKEIRQQVFEQLLSQITTGKWKPGEKIPSENELTSIMGVSRISVREAIQKLAAMDLVETYRGKGTFVKEFTTNNYLKSLTPMLLMTPDDILFVVEYRRILEVGIIDLYTRNPTSRDIAFFMDKLLRKIGLSGRSIVPMLIGFGCTVPAVMSTRTLPSERDRKMTILLTPFMSCSAKLPIYAFFTSAFFPEYGALVMCALYLTGIVIGILVALLYRKTLFRGDAVPFVMELPNYRLPGLKNVMQLLWEKAKDFLQKAFTVIFVATICIWFLQKFDLHFNLVADSKDSILAMISNCLVPIFAPLGLGDWRICTSLISGVMAKESVISTLEILFGGAVKNALTPVAAASLLVFSLLYTPCIAAIASIRRELGRKWAVGMVIWQCMIAWVAAFAVRWLMVLFMR